MHLPGLCFAGVPPGDSLYSEDCTYIGRNANGDSVPGATAQWKVEPGVVPLVRTTLDPIGRLHVVFSAPAAPGDSVQFWACASTLPPPCTLIDYGGTVHFQ